MRRLLHDSGHLVRPAIVLLAAMGLFLVIRAAVIPKNFGQYGPSLCKLSGVKLCTLFGVIPSTLFGMLGFLEGWCGRPREETADRGRVNSE